MFKKLNILDESDKRLRQEVRSGASTFKEEKIN